MNVPALALCVGDAKTFLATHWAQEPLFTAAVGGSDGFADLASLDDLDHMISSQGLFAANLRMVKDGKTLAPSSYSTEGSGRTKGTHGLVSPALVFERYAEGATIVLESVHRYWRPLTQFSRSLETELGHRIQINAYITPPGSQGFAAHRDDHDVFVLQVSGSKHWVIYDQIDDDRALIDRRIEAGDSLYIPAGFPHAATTGENASAHLTVGVLTHKTVDVLREVVKLAGEDAGLIERLPLGATGDGTAIRTVVERSLEEIKRWLEKVDPEVLTERIARRVLSSAQPMIRGQLRQLQQIEGIDATTTVARRPGATCVLLPSGTSLKLLLSDRELEVPEVARGAIEEIIRRDRFRVGELDGPLEGESNVVLVRRLVREGLLEVIV